MAGPPSPLEFRAASRHGADDPLRMTHLRGAKLQSQDRHRRPGDTREVVVLVISPRDFLLIVNRQDHPAR